MRYFDDVFRPVIEMTIPSVLDQTLAPTGCHVIQLFTQYTPYQLGDGRAWDATTKAEYANVGECNSPLTTK